VAKQLAPPLIHRPVSPSQQHVQPHPYPGREKCGMPAKLSPFCHLLGASE